MSPLLLFVNVSLLIGILHKAYSAIAYLYKQESLKSVSFRRGIIFFIAVQITPLLLHCSAAVILCGQRSLFYRFGGVSILMLYVIDVFLSENLRNNNNKDIQNTCYLLLPVFHIIVSSIIFMNL